MTPSFLLILAALATAPNNPTAVSAGEAMVCDFEEAADRDYDGWPDHWIRKRSRELPEFLRIGIVAEPGAGHATTANHSLQVELNGGGAIVCTPPCTISSQFSLALSIRINAAAASRNDTIADATPVGNGTHSASISPAGDPAGTFAPDEDYYAVTTTGDSTVTVDIDAQVNGSPVDTVIEFVNAAGTRLTNCVAPAYTSPCVSDDEDLGVDLDSFLQVRVTGVNVPRGRRNGRQSFSIYAYNVTAP